MKKLVIALCAALALLLCTCALADEAPSSSLEMTRLMGNGTNLGNTMEACSNALNGGNVTDDPTYYETSWGQPITTPEMMQDLKSYGFDTIRIPVAWMTNATHLPQGDATISEAYLDRVEEIVNYALDAGMFVIVNDHWDGGWWGMFGSESAETRELAMNAYINMWTQIADRFADYDYHLIFEGANEEIGPRFDENSPLFCQDSLDSYLTDNERYELANLVNQTFVDTVRATGGNNADRYLLIPGYGTNIQQTCDLRFKMPADSADDKLLISVHCYTPWSYCGASSAKTATQWGTQAHYAELESELRMMQKFTAQGIGVVIGEYGALPGADGIMKDNSVAYHRCMLDLCDMFDYCPCLWDCSGFYIRSERKFADQDMAELYISRRRSAEGGHDEVVTKAKASFDADSAAAPESFRTDTITLNDDTVVAWIMWSSGDWALSYSVGDTYTPDSISPGIISTDVIIDGEGTYTVALDFTGTDAGYSNNVAFSAIGFSNAEIVHPGWAVHVQDVRINGQSVKLKGRPYTTSDDGICTRVNLYNEWVLTIPDDARVLYGPNIGITPVPLNRDDDVMSHIETIEVTFVYGEKQ